MDDQRVRQRRELVIVGWSACQDETTRPASGHIIEYENGRWEFVIDGFGVVRGDTLHGESQIVMLVMRATHSLLE